MGWGSYIWNSIAYAVSPVVGLIYSRKLPFQVAQQGLQLAWRFFFGTTTPEPNASDLSDFQVSGASMSTPVPVVIGTRRVPLNCLWFGDLHSANIREKIEGKKQIVGYSYKLSMLWAIGQPVDSITEFWRGGKKAWSGTLSADGGTFAAMTGDKARLYGSKNGKSTGYFYTGNHSSIAALYQTVSGDAVQYKGTALLWFYRAFIGDNVTAVPNYLTTVKHVELVSGWDNSDVNGDANAAEVLYWILTTQLQIPTALIDDTVFRAVAATLYTEDLGISINMNSGRAAGDWINDILAHIDGFMYLDPTTGKITLSLNRDDYVVGSLTTLNSSQISNLQIRRTSWSDVFTDLEITYTSRDNWKATSYRLVNPAARALVGEVRKQSLSMTFYTRESVVAAAAARLQKRAFYPYASLSFKVSRAVLDPVPGQVLKITSTAAGLTDMVIRVVSVSAPEGDRLGVTVEAIEEVVGTYNASAVTPPGPGQVPIDYRLTEACSHVAVLDGWAEIKKESNLIVLASPPATDLTAENYYVKLNDDPQTDLAFCGTGTVQTAWDGSTIDRTVTGIVIEGCEGVSAVTNTDAEWQRMVTTAILHRGGQDWELVSIKTIVAVSATEYRLTGIIRTINGIPETNMPIGTRVWILPEGPIIEHFFDLAGVALNVPVAVVATPENVMEAGLDTTVSYTYEFTPETPYPVYRPHFDAEILLGAKILQFTPRNRQTPCLLAGAANIDSHAIGDDTEYDGCYWLVTGDDGTSRTVLGTPYGFPTYTLPGFAISLSTPVTTYHIRTVHQNGRMSAAVDVTG